MIVDAPVRANCQQCGRPADFWDGNPGAAICRGCLRERQRDLIDVLTVHRLHDRLVRNCPVCLNGGAA